MILLLAFACSDRVVDVDDDSASIRLFRRGVNDEVASPYVQGGEVTFTVSADRFWGNPERWVLSAEGVTLARAEDDGSDSVRWTATFDQAGATILTITQDGDVMDQVGIEVFAPERIELTPRSAVLADLDAQPIDELTVMAGTESAWHVRYRADGRTLYGSNALQLTGSEGFATDLRDYSAGREDVLVLTAPLEEGVYDVELGTSGQPVEALTVHVVGAESITRLELVADSEEGAEDGDVLDVVLRGWSNDAEVHGLHAEWAIEGLDPEETTGDRYTYTYDARIERQLTARLGEDQETVTIHGIGDVGSSVNCSVGALPAGLVLGLGALVSLRRR